MALSFYLTGLIVTHLTQVRDDNLRQRDAKVKSMDDLRTSMDDLVTAFSGYYARALALVQLKENRASKAAIATARTAYDTAYYHWVERFTADAPNIIQRYPQKPGETYLNDVLNKGSYFGDKLGALLHQRTRTHV